MKPHKLPALGTKFSMSDVNSAMLQIAQRMEEIERMKRVAIGTLGTKFSMSDANSAMLQIAKRMEEIERTRKAAIGILGTKLSISDVNSAMRQLAERLEEAERMREVAIGTLATKFSMSDANSVMLQIAKRMEEIERTRKAAIGTLGTKLSMSDTLANSAMLGRKFQEYRNILSQIETSSREIPDELDKTECREVVDFLDEQEFYNLSVLERLDVVAQAIKDQPSLSRKQFLLIIFTHLIGMVIQILAQPLLQLLSPKRPATEVVRVVKSSGKEVLSTEEERATFRVVTKDNTIIRKSRRRRSERIAVLNAGAIVQFVEKHKHWTLIEIYDVSEEEWEQGWIRTKYLTRFD